METDLQGDDNNQKREKQKQWGPMVVERRNKGNINTCQSALEKAQELKKCHNLKKYIGNSFAALSHLDLCDKSECIGINLGDNAANMNDNIQKIIELEVDKVDNFVEHLRLTP